MIKQIKPLTIRYICTKIFSTAHDAVKDIPSGSKLLVGGFGLCGIPENLIQAIQELGCNNLTCVSNNAGVDDFGLGLLLQSNQIKRMISSHVGENKLFENLYLTGQLEVDLVPQGTLAEQLRAGGAGIPAFYTPTGCGTVIEKGGFPIKYNPDKTVAITSKPRETRSFNGRNFVMEEAIRGDYALIKAWKGDKLGNLVFKATSRNFNPDCAKAANISIAEVEELVEPGELKPDEIHLPGIYVDRIVLGTNYQKRIEHIKTSNMTTGEKNIISNDRIKIAKRAACEVKEGMYVNLGIGMPTLVSNYIPKSSNIFLQSENGLIGIGPYPTADKVDPDIINAGKESITYIDGACFESSSDAFALIRGNHLHMTILGALEVSEYGDLSNWIVPGKIVKGMGGAMDLVSSGSKVVIAMDHCSKLGKPKIVKSCTYPETGYKVVDVIITNLGVFNVDSVEGLTLIEIASNTSIDEIKRSTDPNFKIADDLKPMRQS
eukprot:gene10919-14657_t